LPLTDAGSDALKLWSSALEQYRNNLDAFFSLYTGTREPAYVLVSLRAPPVRPPHPGYQD